MFKHKIIIKSYRSRQRVRQSLGMERVHTTYPDNSDDDQKQVIDCADLDTYSNYQDSLYSIEGFFEENQYFEPISAYNPYDVVFGGEPDEQENQGFNKIHQINSQYSEKICQNVETVELERKVHFSSEIAIKYYIDQSPPIEIQHQTQYKVVINSE